MSARAATPIARHMAPLQVCLCPFFPVLIYIMCGKVADGVGIPANRKRIFKERLFASLLVIAHNVRDVLELQLTAISRRARPQVAATELQLQHLIALKLFLMNMFLLCS